MSLRILADETFPAAPDKLQQVRGVVKRVTREAGCSADLSQKLVLVVDEACTNIIRHAYRGQHQGAIQLVLSREGDTLVFELHDDADPVDPTCIKPRDLRECRPGGLGVNFIDSVMDSWEFRRPADGQGNLLYMTKKIA